MAYLDYNASAPLREPVKDVLHKMLGMVGNASSVHTHGRYIRSLMDQARRDIAEILNTSSEQIIFTSGATEANNMVLNGFKGPIIVSAIEHPSVREARNDALICPVTSTGVVDMNVLEEMTASLQSPFLVCVMHANNETGVIQPINEISKLVHAKNGFMFCDATQTVGKMPVSLDSLGVDVLSFSGHKLGALSGIGACILRESFPFSPMIKGGGQERFKRAGTENNLGILSLAIAIKESCKDSWEVLEKMRDDVEREIETWADNAYIVGKTEKRLPQTSLIAMPGVSNDIQLIQFDLKGVSVSTGSACSSGKVRSSHVLDAMRLDEWVKKSVIRMSFGHETTQKDLKLFVDAWKTIYDNRKLSAEERKVMS